MKQWRNKGIEGLQNNTGIEAFRHTSITVITGITGKTGIEKIEATENSGGIKTLKHYRIVQEQRH